MKLTISLFIVVVLSCIFSSCANFNVNINANETTISGTKTLEEKTANMMTIGESEKPISIEKVRYEEKNGDSLCIEASFDKFVMSDTFAFKYQGLNAELLDFNNYNEEEAHKFLEEYKDDVVKYREQIHDANLYYTNESTVNIQRNDEKIFSFTNGLYTFLGGVHGSFGTVCYNYDKNGGYILKNDDILKNKDLFFEKLYNKLEAPEYEELLFTDYKDTIQDMISQKTEFSLVVHDDGIEVLFDPYLIGPWASSTISVHFDYKDNKDMLNNDLFE